MDPVTVWHRFDEDKKVFVHNHIEQGHVFGPTPVPKSDHQQASWKGAYWRKYYATMIGWAVTNKVLTY